MKGLLRSANDPTNPSRISAIKSTNVATADSILDESTKEAAAANDGKKTGEPPVLPKISSRADANDEADRFNEQVQAIIGTKETIAKALTAKFGS